MAAVEIRDPTIKLFGKTIALPLSHVAAPTEPSAAFDQPAESAHDAAASGCRIVASEITAPKYDSADRPEDQKEITLAEEFGDGNANQITDQTTSEISENENPSVERETSSPKASKNGEQSETSISPDKTVKKPDKILPCPRCKSMDTKFCYFNNYNVNQPRHFCKNCQRYWTAGGTMRNVPVGAGRRKNKNSPSQFRHLVVSDNGVHPHHYLPNKATFLTFGSDSLISDANPDGFHISGDNGDDHSSISSITASNSSEKALKTTLQQPAVKSFFPFSPHLQSFPGLPWPYSCSPPMAPPAFYAPVPYFPAPWGCTVPPSWSLPSLNGQNPLTNSSALGKHSRDGKIINNAVIKQKSSSETCLWAPKTLRVDDPKEAAKSSIWSTLGIRNEKESCINGGGLFGSFQQKGKEENPSESVSLLQANPAAFSRALKFREIA